MIKVYLGTTNKAKVSAVEEVLNAYLDDFKLIPQAVNSGVNNQPFSEEETIRGAYNRANGLPKDGLRIGLEAGVDVHHQTMFLINYGVLIDQDDNVYYAGSTRIPLPNEVRVKLEEGTSELAEIMEEYTKTQDVRSKQGAIGVLTNDVVTRKDIFISIMKLLYGQYLYKNGGKK